MGARRSVAVPSSVTWLSRGRLPEVVVVAGEVDVEEPGEVLGGAGEELEEAGVACLSLLEEVVDPTRRCPSMTKCIVSDQIYLFISHPIYQVVLTIIHFLTK